MPPQLRLIPFACGDTLSTQPDDLRWTLGKAGSVRPRRSCGSRIAIHLLSLPAEAVGGGWIEGIVIALAISAVH